MATRPRIHRFVQLKHFWRNWSGPLIVSLIFVPIVILYSFDVPDSPPAEIYGVILQRTFHTATEHELPGFIVRVELESGEIIDLGIPDQRAVHVGDTIIVAKSSTMLTGSDHYEFRGVKVE